MKSSFENHRLTTYLILCFLPVFFWAQSVPISETMPDLLKVPALSYKMKIPPESDPLKPSFDKRILVEMSDGNDMFLYINTVYGQVGYTTGPIGSLGSGEIEKEDSKLNFHYFHPDGKVYTFQGEKDVYVKQDYVIESMSLTSANETLRKQAKTKSFFPQNFRSQSYKTQGSDAPTLFLYGSYFPMELINVKMLGHKGVGYMLTNYAVYLVLEKHSSTENLKVIKWENVNLELDFSNFTEQKLEERAY